MSEPKTATRVYLTAGQRNRLRQLSQAEDLPVSWLIRRAIDEFLAQHALKPTSDE